MTKASFMDSILNRPSQRYTEPLDTKSSRKAHYQTPSDLPNAPNKPNSILAGDMFQAAGAGSLHQGAGTYSQAPSVMSGKSNTSRFSIFRKKGRQPDISGGSVYYDGASSVAQTDVGATSRKGRWWESGGLTRNNYSSPPPSLAGSVFSEPEAANPSAFASISSSLPGTAPPRGATSDYGGPTSSRKRHSSQPAVPPLPPLASKASMSSMRRQSGLAPLAQQPHNLTHTASSPAMARSPSSVSQAQSNVDLARPVSPAASMGRARSPGRAAANGSSDWNSFVQSMSGTEVAKMWETMPTLAPKPSRTSEKRSSVVANRVRKELEQDAQFQQVQRDPGVVNQDLLARAASQVIGEMPPTPVSPISEPHLAPAVHLQPGQVVAPVAPISPVYSPVASNSSLNVAQHPVAMSPQASAVLYGSAAPAPVSVPQAVPMVPVIHSPQPQQHFVSAQLLPEQYGEGVPAQAVQLVPVVDPTVAPGTVPQQYIAVPVSVPVQTAPVPVPVQVPVQAPEQVPVALPASSPLVHDSPVQTFAPLAVPTRRAAPQPVNGVQESAPVPSSPSLAAPQLAAAPAIDSSAAPVQAPPTTAQFLADRVDEQESADRQALPEEEAPPSDESEASDEMSSDDGLVGGGQPTLDAVAEEEEEGSSIDHNYHHEMRKRNSIKGKGPSRNYDQFEARLHRRQASAQSQLDDSHDDEAPVAPSDVQIQVTEPPTQDLPAPTQQEAFKAQPALGQAVQAAPQLEAPERPRLVSCNSEYSDYQSAKSGASTPTRKDRSDDDDAHDDAAAVASIVRVQLPAEAEEEGDAADTASIAPSQRPSVRTSRSSRPGTLQRRLSEVSLGTSFAVSGILRRPASSRRFAGDGDSDSGAELSDDDAELRAKALAEQDRLRKMNVGDDFFGPSLSTLLDKFDRFSYSDSTVNKLKREPELARDLSGNKGETLVVSPVAAAAPAANGVDTGAQQTIDADAEAQQAINEVRQKRADAVAEGKRRNSADTAALAPSFAAVWLLNQAQGPSDPAAAASRGLVDEEGDQTITAATPPHSASNFSPSSGPEKAKESVLNRPRPKSQRPLEMGGVAISEGRLEADRPQAPVKVEDTRSTLPMSLSQRSIPSAGSTPTSPQSKQSSPSPIVASKDKPAPVKSAMKPKPTRSLADTLFGMSFRSPSKDKKDKKDKSKHSRKVSVDSIGSASVKSDRSSIIASSTQRSSTDTAARSALATPSASVPPSPSPSAKALGKQRMTDDAGSTSTPPPQQPSGIMPSETHNNFATPPQSMANLQGAAGADASPEKFHTAHDLKALADAAIPSYPTDLKAVPPMPNGAADVRPEHQRQLSEQMKTMDGFGSFTLPQLEQRQIAPPVVERSEEAVNASETSVSADHSAAPSSSEPSVTSTIPTSPETEPASNTLDKGAPVVTQVAESEPAEALPSSQAMDMSERKLPMPPPPAVEEVMASTHDDRTPTGKPKAIPGVGINLIPPTPPALESRNSFTSSQVPGTPTIAEQDEFVTPQRPPLMSRSSSQRTAVRSDSKADAPGESLSRSRSMAPAKKGIWQEYKGKGLSLPPGLVATTIDSSQQRRKSTSSQHSASAAPAASASRAGAGHAERALPALPVNLAVGQIVATAPPSVLESPPRHRRSASSPSPKSKRSNGSLSPIAQSPTLNRLMAEAPPVPQIPAGYQAPASVSSSSSRLYANSVADSEQAWESRSASPAPSAVPSQSGRSVASHVSSSVHSASYRSSPRPEYSYVNHHELSPYAKRMRSLSPSPALPTLSQTGNRHSLMSAINEWESQVPETGEAAGSLSPYPSRPTSPSPYPALPASTVSRSSSVISSISSPAVVRNAPLGASTNQYLHPPIPRSRMSMEGLSAVSESAIESLNPPSVVGHPSGPSSAGSSSPSASQSALSLSSTIPTSMPTVPTSYRPNKDPKRFSTNADDLLNNRTTMQSIAVTSGAFASRSKSVVKRKKSVDLNGDRRTSADVPEHLQDELSLTTLSVTAHTPPPRKIGSHQVLVQVIAVAIDETDKLLLREKVRAENAFGFVPGRSFCGRIVECGYEVKKMRKGDVVFGLQDSRKSGALAEFMVIDYNRVCHAPSDCLTTEQIAALPSAGVMAHQLIQNHCRQLPRGARVLILNAHDGVGLLTMQESVGLGLLIVAQCPPSISDGVAVCQANGAHEVVVGEPLWAINSLHESSFDLIVDTVGGRKVYDASRRILAFEGQFCTCFGDEHGTANPNLKSHFRSLRRAFFKKDKKNIGYEWVGIDSGEDCKEALEAVKRAAEQGNVCPRLRSVLPFADASRAFDPTTRNVNDEPGAIVVRVS